MKKLKYQTKFFLYHTVIMMIIILGLVGYFNRIVVGEMKEKEEQDFRIITEKTATQLDILFYDMDRAALQIAANPDIVRVFQSLPAEPEENYFTSHPIVTGEVKKLLESYNFKNDGHSRICLYNRYDDWVCTSNRAVTERGVKQFFAGTAFRDVREFFQEADRYVFYREPGTDVLASGEAQRTDYLAVVREIKDYYSNSSRCGYVEVQESTEKLDGILADFGPGIQAEILNQDGKSIYRTTGGMDLEGKDIYRMEVPLENAPYSVKLYKNPVEFNHAMNQFYLVLAATVGIIMLVAVMLEQILVRHLSKPLVNLNDSMKSITMDNLHVAIADEDSADIVLRLEDSFNAMLKKLNDSMQNQITAKTNEVKSHFFALQSQMNPHFLHNMLAIISMESQLDGNEKVPDICQKLGEILRYNTQMGDGFSTVEKEFAIAEDYMLLMKVRYEDLFEFQIQTEEDAGYIGIPKLIIQPLCENCFQHGLKNVNPVWNISIRAWTEADKWYITVKDNGSGFSDEFLDKFRKQKEELDRSDVKAILENIAIGGLCLPNIYTRMKITYGESFVFQLYNGETGAVVLLGGELNDKSTYSGR